MLGRRKGREEGGRCGAAQSISHQAARYVFQFDRRHASFLFLVMLFFFAQVRVLHLSALQQRRQHALLARSIQTHDRIQVNPKFTCFTGTKVLGLLVQKHKC